MNKFTSIIFSTLTLLMVISACAVEKDEDPTVINEKFIRAYMQKYYPGIEPNEHGIYVLEHQVKDSTRPKVTDLTSSYLLTSYSMRNMDGTYTFSSYDSVAKKVGAYDKAKYYGPHIWPYGQNIKAVGIEEVLDMMREKDKISALIPNELLSKTANGSKISTGNSDPKIYDIQIDSIIADIDQYEFSQMSKFARNFDNVDPISGQMEFISKLEETKDTIANNDYVRLRYVGKLLNGFVFDSNIRDTAKKYDFLIPDNEYKELDIKFHKDSASIVSGNSMIIGFSLAISKMNYGEHAICFFHSDYGYGDTGNFFSDGKIPEFSPLAFEIWIEEKPEGE